MSTSTQSIFARFRNELGLVIAILAVLSITSMINQDYFREPWRNFRDIAQETSLVGIFALGAAIVIIAGGIDLSSGTMILFSASVCVLVTYIFAPISGGRPNPAGATNLIVWLGVAAAIGSGLLVGTFHAWLITIVKLPPFIATLATLVGLRSLTKIMNSGVTESLGIKVQSINASASLFGDLRAWWVPVVVFVCLGLLLWMLMNRTVVGRHLYALGGNEEAARLSGINTDNLKWLAYSIGSVTASIAGVLYAAKISTCTPSSMGVGYELNAIAAAVVGGCSLQGGTGLIPGVMLGVLFLQVVIDAVAKVFKTNPDDWKGQIVGLLVVLAVAFNEIRHGGSAGRKRMFPGAIGWVTIPLLSLVITLEIFAADTKHRLGASLTVGGLAFAALLGRKLYEDYAGQSTPSRPLS